jgi:hypothetical protein
VDGREEQFRCADATSQGNGMRKLRTVRRVGSREFRRPTASVDVLQGKEGLGKGNCLPFLDPR